MACTKYQYYNIFKEYGTKLNELIVGPAYDPADSIYSDAIYNPMSTSYIGGIDNDGQISPFRIFRNIDDLLAAPAECFYDSKARNPIKGLLIWDAQRYYNNNNIFPVRSSSTTGTWTETSVIDPGSVALSVGCFIIPSFGQVTIVPRIEYKQNITITFDSNSDPNFDLYGSFTMEYIDWFINANHLLVNDAQFCFPIQESNVQTYIMLQSISEPIYSPNSGFVRRAVTLTLRYCNCC